MGTLAASLNNAANALHVYEGALDVTQNNVTNANTPGYANQVPTLVAQPFNVLSGSPGGVHLGITENTRDQFAEQSVRTQQSATSYDQQQVSDLSTAQNYFSLSTTSGIGPSISALFQGFSQLSVTPNDTVARQNVLNEAATVAQNFNNTANGLLSQANGLQQATTSTISAINDLGAKIAQINAENPVDLNSGTDAGVDAQLNAALDQLSQYVNFSILRQGNGQVSVYLGGQTPLVMGDQSFTIAGDFSTPQTVIQSSSGADITGQLTGGQLGAELNDKNNLLPSYVSNLNTLAQTLADQVNNALNNGIDQNGAAPVTNLFSYDATNGAALTLNVNPLTPDQIAAALPGATGGNGNALAIAALANAPVVNGYTFAQSYGNLGGQVGSDLAAAQNNSTTNQALLTQSEALRQQVSGVSLNQQAENMLDYQRSYDAITKMIGILNSLSLGVINILPPISTA
ncbi:MAG TPA: flagellar hook-associated protein FlgK [Bryobacteraceae bacterium]|nr:flagellar hook-associated protein FlgK [Bryobacteraceae bacterium]